MEKSDNKYHNILTRVGLLFNAFAFALYLLFKNNQDLDRNTFILDDGGVFMTNFVLSIIYFIAILFNNAVDNGFWKFGKLDRRHFLNSLVLFCISSFTVNLTMPIFSEFPYWVDIYLILMFLPLFLLGYKKQFPKALMKVAYFLMGAGTMMSLYFTIYLVPMMPIGLIGAIFFGLSLHLLSPLFLLFAYIVQFIKESPDKLSKASFFAGLVVPLIFLGIYLTKWNEAKIKLHEANASIITRSENPLPAWVLMSQKLGNDFFNERIIKGHLIYDTPTGWRNSWGMPRTSFNEIKEHDPLVYTSLALLGELPISSEDRIKILESKFDARHNSHRKLWRGDDLSTTEVLTNIDVYPDYRLAYLEKYIKIRNHARWNNSQQEALYSFHLPEGSVVTSLSLWIEGVEEKSRLTTRKKADSAYATIVGLEMRDPALLHWQEGNTISVTIFPCTPVENRQFKVGFTIPLDKSDESLILKNIYFEGPKVSQALETTVIRLHSDNECEFLNLPSSFESTDNNVFQYMGDYRPYWELNVSNTPLSNKSFSFNNKTFQIKAFEAKREAFNLKSVYLDINKSWTQDNFAEVWTAVNDKKVYVFDDQLKEINEENKDDLFARISEMNFSLFPIYLIDDPTHSLIISKSSDLSPNLKDLGPSKFIDFLEDYLKEDHASIPFYCIGQELSPYLASLKEFGVFNFENGNVQKLQNLLEKREFVLRNKDSNLVVIHNSEMSIRADSGMTKSLAPDHLMRLFAYNQIALKMSKHYFESNDYVTDELITIANEAFVVSPISSLVVLESIKDYERFGIDENKDSLKNASSSSSGAVPEPHEWALILLAASILTWLTYKRYKVKKQAV